MNGRLMRPTAALFPLAALIAVAMGSALAGRLVLLYHAMQLCTLCAVDCFRNGAAREPGVRRADRRFGGGITQLVLGMGLLLAGMLLCPVLKPHFNAGLFAAAGCVTLEQLFEERMYALGRRVDGVVLSVIANLLLVAGLLLDGAGGVELELPHVEDCPFTLGGAALGALIALGTAYLVEPGHGFSLKPVNLALFPRACVQTLLYPAAALAIAAVLPEDVRGMYVGLEPLLYGLILWRLARTTCRRTDEESRPLNLLLMALMAIPAIIWALRPDGTLRGMELLPFAAAALLAGICAGIVFCAPAWRYWLGCALLLAAGALDVLQPLPEMWNMAAGCVCCMIALVLNLHTAFLRKAKRPEPRC